MSRTGTAYTLWHRLGSLKQSHHRIIFLSSSIPSSSSVSELFIILIMMKCTAWHLCFDSLFYLPLSHRFWTKSFMQFWSVSCASMVPVEVDGQSQCWFPSSLTCQTAPLPSKQYHRGHLYLCCLKLLSSERKIVFSDVKSQCLLRFWAGIRFWTNQKVCVRDREYFLYRAQKLYFLCM